jgi:DNA replication and repair protein RecF
MNLNHISLYNFRNFTQVDELELPENALLVAAAPNASGKTNFLEAIAFLLRGKSFRASAEECARWGEDFVGVGAIVKKKEEEAILGARYQVSTKKLRIEEDGQPASLVTFFSRYPLVMFLPEDTFLFARGPAQRRNFLNSTLVGAPTYVSSLVQYQRALRQRNASLKKARAYEDIRSWTDLVVEYAAGVWQQRQNFVSFIQGRLMDVYEKISGESREFECNLISNGNGIDGLAKDLEKSFEYESRYGYTMYGPHRDDLEITTNQKPVAAVLSQGQTRSLVISLKLIAHSYIKKVTKEEPILLLDEVLSELDESRQAALLLNLPNAQTFLTCTKIPPVLHNRENAHVLDLRLIGIKMNEDEKELEVEEEIEDTETINVQIT